MQAVLLAAGLSSRAGVLKLAWPIEGRSLLSHLVGIFQKVCNEIIVVTGYHQREVEELLSNTPHLRFIHNPNPENGMFSSIRLGVSQVDEDFFVCPGDIPGINQHTLLSLLSAHGTIRVPTYRGKNGHPVFFDFSLKTPLLQEPESSTLKEFITRSGKTTVPVLDSGILFDIDTREDYEEFLARGSRSPKASPPRLQEKT